MKRKASSGYTRPAKYRKTMRTKKFVPRYRGKKNIASKVKYLMKVNKVTHESTFYQVTGNAREVGGAAYVSPADALAIDQFPLTQFGTWVRAFGTRQNDETKNTAMMKSMKVRMNMDIRDRQTRDLGYTVIIASPTKIADANYDKINGTFIQIRDGYEYIVTKNTDPVGLSMKDCEADTVMLNPRYFRTHYKKVFFLGNADDNINPTDTRSSIKRLVVNLKKPMTIRNPAGDWHDLANCPSFQQNMIILVFSHKSGYPGVGVARFSYNALVSMDV